MRRSEVPSDQISDFLDSKGGPELILEIGTKGSRWKDLINELQISTATLERRLETARDIDLVGTESRESGTSVSNYYILNTLGEMIYHQMHNTNTASTWSYLKDTRKEFESQKEQLIEWVKNDEILEVYKAHKKKEQTGDRLGSPDWDDDTDS